MTDSQLNDLIAKGENNQVEFKRHISAAQRIARTLSAFANSSGGTLLIGITDNGKIMGVSSEFDELSKIEEATERYVDPPLTVSYRAITPNGRTVLIVNVLESEEKPHYVFDESGTRTIYVRMKDKSVPTSKFIIASDVANAELIKSPMVRTLLMYLRKNDFITVDRFAKLINVSDYRAAKVLRQLAERGLLLFIDKPRPIRYALKLAE